MPAYRGDQLQGFVYLNSDFANATGYSGKPIQLLVGIDPKGVLTGLKLVEHKEPIVLLGIPEKRVLDAVNKLIGADMDRVARGTAPAPQVDIVSGATVTVLVMGDSIVRSATKLIKSGRLGAQGNAAASAAPQASKTIDPAKAKFATGRAWSVTVPSAGLILSVADVNKAFEKSGNAAAAAHPEEGDPDDTFIDLYVADVAVPTIGRSLLGDDGYNRLAGRLKPGQQALVVAGSGRYSFKGAAYVRGGIFDRIELIQDTNSIRFRDRDHTRLGSLAAEGAPDFPEIALFTVPPEFAFDPTEPWVLQLLVQRVVGARDKAWLTFDLGYTLPDVYLKREAPPVQPAAAPAAKSPAPPAAERREAGTPPTATEDEPLWMQIWRGDVVKIGTTVAALGALTLIFFFQNFLVRRPAAIRLGPPRLPALHSGLARLVCERPALGGQRPDLRQFAADRLQLGILPVRPADLPALGLDRRRTAVLGARTVLRLALPVRRAAGIAQQHRPGGEDPAIPSAVGPARAAVADQVHHLSRPVRHVAVLDRVRRATGRGRAVQDRHRPEVRARMAVRHLRADAAFRRPVRRAVLLPLHVPARRGAGDSRAASGCSNGCGAGPNAARPASAAPRNARCRRSIPRVTSTSMSASTACIARNCISTTTAART